MSRLMKNDEKRDLQKFPNGKSLQYDETIIKVKKNRASLKSSDYYWPEPEPVALIGGSAYTRIGLYASIYGNCNL